MTSSNPKPSDPSTNDDLVSIKDTLDSLRSTKSSESFSPPTLRESHGRGRKMGSHVTHKLGGSGGGDSGSGATEIQEDPVDMRHLIKTSSRSSTPRAWKRIEPHTARPTGTESTETPPLDSPISPPGRRGSVRNILFPNFMRSNSQTVVLFPSLSDKTENINNKGENENGSEKAEAEHFRSKLRGLSEPNLPSCPKEEREKAENLEEIPLQEKDTQETPPTPETSSLEKEGLLEPRKRTKKRGQLNRNLSAPRLSKFTGNPISYLNQSQNSQNDLSTVLSEGDAQFPILEDLIKKMMKPNGLVIKDRKWHTKTFKSCFVGKEMVDWLVSNNYVITREEAIKIGKNFITFGLMEQVTSEGPFKDEFQYYRFRKQFLPSFSPMKKITKGKQPKPKLTKGKSVETLKSMINSSPVLPPYSPKRQTNFGDSPGVILSTSGNIPPVSDLLPKKGVPEFILPKRATEQKSGNPISQTGTESLPKKAGLELITPYRAMITEKKTVNTTSEKYWTRSPKNSFSEKKTERRELKKSTPTPEKITQGMKKKSIDSPKNSLVNKHQKKKLQKSLKKQAKEREKKTKEKEMKLVQHLNGLLEKGHRHVGSPPAPELHFLPAPPLLPVM